MTEKSPLKVSFDFPGAMRQLGRFTRRTYDTVKDKTSEWDTGAEKGAEKDEESKEEPRSQDKEKE